MVNIDRSLNSELNVHGIINFGVYKVESCSHITFGACNVLLISVLLWTTIIHQVIK